MDEFFDLMQQEVQRRPAATVSLHGVRSFKADVPYRCHVKMGAIEVTQPDSETATAEGQAWLAGYHPEWSTADRIRLPDGRETGVVQVNTIYDEQGPHHTAILFGGKGSAR